VQAVALSCNSYFTALGASLEPRQVREAAKQFALVGPPANASAGALAGRYGLWRETPEALVHAYAELLARRDQPGIADIVAGMRESAKRGTGSGISASVPDLAIAAKTGTAPCTHLPHAPGDGFALAAWPADSPRYILLVRQHGRPGALAAVIAGKMIRELEQQP
jgi:cell division protein FtsI/penicillin-binding protein 2